MHTYILFKQILEVLCQKLSCLEVTIFVSNAHTLDALCVAALGSSSVGKNDF